LLIALVSVTGGWLSALLTLAVFFFVLLHEYGHCFAAKYYGLEVTDITLYPIGGVARIPCLGAENPWKRELVIALAGPAVNIVLCGITILVLLAIGVNDTPASLAIGYAIGYAFALNLVLAIFNLLPIFPMDGGRVLRASLYGIMQDYERSTEIAVRIGQGLAIGMIILAVMSGNVFMGIIFGLVCLGAQAELLQVKRQVSLERLKAHLAKELEKPELANANLPQLIEVLEDVEDEELRREMSLNDLLPMLKQQLESQQNRQSS
jgi:stage IV sporulation protein FB